MNTIAVIHTRYPELGIAQHGPRLWRIVTDGDPFSPTGPQYATKAEALADLDRFAASYGATGANPDPYARIAALESALAESERKREALAEALERVASETCDHGPGFCPRDHARAALAQNGGK